MNNLNTVLIEGQLTSNPELSYKPNGFLICTFEIGCTRYHKKGEEMVKEVSFFEIRAPGEQGERCAVLLEVRRGVRVVGRLEEVRWADDQGDTHSKVYVVAEYVEFKPKKELSDKEALGEAANKGQPA